MKQLLMLVAVAAVAGAMYVASASGSQLSAGVTATQFNALKKQVAALSKRLKTTQNTLNGLGAAYLTCSLSQEFGIQQKGGDNFGYNWTFPVPSPAGFTTAIDLSQPGAPYTLYDMTTFNGSVPACVSLVGRALRHNSAAVFAQKFAQKP